MAELKQEPPARAQGGSIIRWIVTIVVLAAIAFWFFRGRRAHDGGKGGQTNMAQNARQGGGAPGGGGGGRGGFGGPLVVTATNANAGDIGVYVSALGSVTPLSTVAVRSRVEGQLIKIYYTEG